MESKNNDKESKFVIIADLDDNYLQQLQADGWTICKEWILNNPEVVIHNKLYLITKG